MANTTFEERRLLRVDAAEKADLIAKAHRAKAALWGRKGRTQDAAAAIAAAERQEGIAAGHRAEADRLESRAKANAYRLEDGAKQKAALEARDEALKAERPAVDPLQAYIEATQHAQRHEATVLDLQAKRQGLLRVGSTEKAERLGPRILRFTAWADQWRKEGLALIASSGRDLAGEWAAQVAADCLDGEEERARRELRLPTDLRTAGAQREFVAGSSRNAKIASLTEYANLIPKPHARTPVRLDAMARFDRMCSWADAGLFPTVDMEPKARGGSGGGNAYLTGWADALHAMDDLRKAIGGRNVEMLRLRIYQRQTLAQLAREGFGTDKTAGVLTLAAIDAMAVHFAGKPDGNVILAGRQSLTVSMPAE